MAWFHNLRLMNKLFCGFGILLILLAGLGGTFVVIMNVLDHEFTEFSEQGKVLAATSDITRSFANLELHAKEFISASTSENMASAENAYRDASAQIARGLANMHNEEELEQLQDAQIHIEAYWKNFLILAKERSDQNALVDSSLTPAGDTLQKELQTVFEHVLGSELQDGKPTETLSLITDAIIRLLVAKDHANRFVYSHIDTDLEYALSELALVRKDLTSKAVEHVSAEDKLLIADALRLLDVYVVALDKFRVLGEDIQRLQSDVMVKEASIISKDLSQINAIAISTEHAIEEQVHAQTSAALAFAVVATIAGLVIGFATALGLGHMIRKPVTRLVEVMHLLTNNRLDVEIEEPKGRDEIADMTRSVKVFHEALLERHRMREDQAEMEETNSRRRNELDQMVDVFGNAIRGIFQRMSQSSSDMSISAVSLAEISAVSADQSAVLDQDATETSGMVATVSSAAEELIASIEEIRRNADNSAEIASSTSVKAEQTRDNFNQLLAVSNEITNVVDLIREIADQTNLLALNATIEAARAGDAGKGFAVVASEVKELAAQTARATAEISSQVNAVQETAKDAEHSMSEIYIDIGKVTETAVSIAASVSQQKDATLEIARSMETVSQNSSRVQDSVFLMRSNADSSTEAAGKVEGGSSVVYEEAVLLGAEVETFLDAIANQGDDETYRIYDVDWEATVTLEGQIIPVRTRKVSTASCFVDIVLNGEAGTPVVFNSPMLSRPVQARIAKIEDGCTALQFPLKRDHIAKLRFELEQMVVEAA